MISGGPVSGTATVIATTEDGQGTISLSMDDLMQYAQPVPDSVIQDNENGGLEDKLTAGATTKFVQLNMDEFTSTKNQESLQNSGDVDHNDSGEFPDLLDSESNLESLSFATATAVRSGPKSDSLKVHEDQVICLHFVEIKLCLSTAYTVITFGYFSRNPD